MFGRKKIKENIFFLSSGQANFLSNWHQNDLVIWTREVDSLGVDTSSVTPHSAPLSNWFSSKKLLSERKFLEMNQTLIRLLLWKEKKLRVQERGILRVIGRPWNQIFPFPPSITVNFTTTTNFLKITGWSNTLKKYKKWLAKTWNKA